MEDVALFNEKVGNLIPGNPEQENYELKESNDILKA
jgi:hypothetical protein